MSTRSCDPPLVGIRLGAAAKIVVDSDVEIVSATAPPVVPTVPTRMASWCPVVELDPTARAVEHSGERSLQRLEPRAHLAVDERSDRLSLGGDHAASPPGASVVGPPGCVTVTTPEQPGAIILLGSRSSFRVPSPARHGPSGLHPVEVAGASPVARLADPDASGESRMNPPRRRSAPTRGRRPTANPASQHAGKQNKNTDQM